MYHTKTHFTEAYAVFREEQLVSWCWMCSVTCRAMGELVFGVTENQFSTSLSTLPEQM